MKILSLISLLIVSLLLAGCGLQTTPKGTESPVPAGTSTIQIVATPEPDPAANNAPTSPGETSQPEAEVRPDGDKVTAQPGETMVLEAEICPPADKATAPPVETLDLEIITILRKDGIPAILDPLFLCAPEGAEQMVGSERVLGVSINGDHRAYPLNRLSRHEIVNDVVGGMPVAVTW